MNDIELTLQKKANFFKDNDTAVHVVKKNGWFHNGPIISIEYDFLILVDEVDGSMPIFFSEIVDIEKREVKRKKKDEMSKV